MAASFTVNNKTDAPGRLMPTFADQVYAEPAPSDTNGNKLDVYLPEGRGPFPAIIWSTGSAWLRDDGKDGGARWIAAQFIPRGYAVVGVSIRSSSQAPFPAQLYDIRAAIRHVRHNSRSYQLDPGRLVAMGNASGGWAAAMAGATSSIRALDGEQIGCRASSAVQAVVAFSPPVDFVRMDEHAVHQRKTHNINRPAVLLHNDPGSPESRLIGVPLQENPAASTRANPVTYIDGTEPPLAVFHGTHDPLIPPSQSKILFQAWATAGGTANCTVSFGRGHNFVPPEPGEAHSPISLGEPVMGAEQFTKVTARGGVQRLNSGLDPSWDSIAEFLAAALR